MRLCVVIEVHLICTRRSTITIALSVSSGKLLLRRLEVETGSGKRFIIHELLVRNSDASPGDVRKNACTTGLACFILEWSSRQDAFLGSAGPPGAP